MELWQQCAEWLCEAIPLDSTVRFQRLEEFAAFLKDGFALCALANKLSNGCVSQIRRNYNGTSQFISESNLSLFLNACRSTFGIAEKDLFKVEDLSDLVDFSKVLKVLSLLSRSKHAEALGISPFPRGISRRASHHSLDLPDDEAEIYMELQNKRGVDEALPFDTNFDIYETDHNEEIYNTFVYQPTGKTVAKYAEFKPRNKREFCLKELLDTEINYCDTLRMIIEHFYNPMGLIVEPDRHRAIFINVDELQRLHSRFLDKIRKSILVSFGVNKVEEGEQLMRVPEIFILFKLEFLKYTEYCSFLDNSRNEIAKIENLNPEVNRQVEEYRAKAGQQNVKLGDILTVPMQRVLKYHLLLKQLLDNTPPNDEEVQLLDMAYESMKDVSDFVNEGKRDHEIMALIRLVQSKIPNFPAGDQCMQFGRLLQDGPAKVVDSTTGLKPKSRYVFLFEKVLLICKNKDEEIKSTHIVANFKIVEPEQESQLNRSSTLTRKLTTSLFDHTSLMILVKDLCVSAGDPQPYLNLIFRSTQSRDKWREMIESAIEKNNPSTARRLRHRVLYETFKTPTECFVCSKLLLGLFFQGYHCQMCNKNMHYACLDIGQTVCRQPTVSSLIHRSNSSGTTHILMQPQRFENGDRLQAIQNVISPDAAVLSFQKGDIIEVVRENDDGSITGRLFNSPSKVGILSRDTVKRISRSQSLANNNHHSPSQSPMRSIDANMNRLSMTGIGEQVNQRPSLVSSAIIKQFEDAPIMNIEQYPWYFGPLSRNEAKLQLGSNPDGTFLVRKSQNQSQYALSVLFNGNDKHILIEMDSESHHYYLHGGRFFHNIPSLIHYYRTQSLEEGFNDLFTPLKGTPLRNTVFRVIFAFTGGQSDLSRYLTLEQNDLVRVLDTNGEENGWWKGISRGITGYFPLQYVVENNGNFEVENEDEVAQPTEVY